MSWERTTYEGKTCYERNGQRLFRTQDIDALEEAERRSIEIENEKMRFRILHDDDDEIIYHDEDHQNSKSDILIALFIITCFVLMAIFN